MSYTQYFDITQEPYPWRWLAALLLASTISLPFLLVWIRRLSSRTDPPFFAVLPVIITLAIAAISAQSLYRYQHLRGALRAGKCSVVEGIVSDFRPMPPQEHAAETFWVGDVHFSYYRQLLYPAFHQTAIDAGPIHEGLPVRIAYFRGHILKLEIGSAAAVTPVAK